MPGSIGGNVTNIKAGSENQGFELRLDAQISGNGYSGGTVGMQAVGGGAIPGVTVTSSDLQGGFYGTSAVDTGGTFTFGATGVPVVGGGTGTLGAAGFFHGSCQADCP